ncbi:hypothetical protein BDF19DRAFT_446517 [Syncephalis fuscata]|nr:hypothetical protein BDF19DRAFT_446517 [Syncephalis fuscata]
MGDKVTMCTAATVAVAAIAAAVTVDSTRFVMRLCSCECIPFRCGRIAADSANHRMYRRNKLIRFGNGRNERASHVSVQPSTKVLCDGCSCNSSAVYYSILYSTVYMAFL